jgi:hypothetical protein
MYFVYHTKDRIIIGIFDSLDKANNCIKETVKFALDEWGDDDTPYITCIDVELNKNYFVSDTEPPQLKMYDRRK